MKKKALLISLIALAMAICTFAGATIAYLFVTSNTVENTFSYGDINIELKEHAYVNGQLTTDEVEVNNTYKVIPGVTEDKDPFVRVKSGSEKCYVYVCIENELVIGTDVVGVINVDSSKWTAIATSGNKTLYRYTAVVDASSAEQVLPVFTTVTYDGTKILKTNISSLNGKKIVVTAYAHQSENIGGVGVADSAAKTQFGFN